MKHSTVVEKSNHLFLARLNSDRKDCWETFSTDQDSRAPRAFQRSRTANIQCVTTNACRRAPRHASVPRFRNSMNGVSRIEDLAATTSSPSCHPTWVALPLVRVPAREACPRHASKHFRGMLTRVSCAELRSSQGFAYEASSLLPIIGRLTGAFGLPFRPSLSVLSGAATHITVSRARFQRKVEVVSRLRRLPKCGDPAPGVGRDDEFCRGEIGLGVVDELDPKAP